MSGRKSLDIAAGMVLAGSLTGPTFSGHVAFNLTDFAALTVHVLQIREGRTQYVPQTGGYQRFVDSRPVLFVGGRIGSKVGALGAIIIPAAVVGLFILGCHSGGCE